MVSHNWACTGNRAYERIKIFTIKTSAGPLLLILFTITKIQFSKSKKKVEKLGNPELHKRIMHFLTI